MTALTSGTDKSAAAVHSLGVADPVALDGHLNNHTHLFSDPHSIPHLDTCYTKSPVKSVSVRALAQCAKRTAPVLIVICRLPLRVVPSSGCKTACKFCYIDSAAKSKCSALPAYYLIFVLVVFRLHADEIFAHVYG